jgi:hypothetical protein
MGQAVIPQDQRIAVGWREWVALPGLGIPHIKAKIDTGARTSALHTFALLPYREKGRDMVRFSIHPLQKHTDTVVVCRAEVIDRRWVSDSGGHRELRHVIVTPLHLGPHTWPIEITLTARDPMRFRMLLGRTAMGGRLHIIPDASYLVGKARPARH